MSGLKNIYLETRNVQGCEKAVYAARVRNGLLGFGIIRVFHPAYIGAILNFSFSFFIFTFHTP